VWIVRDCYVNIELIVEVVGEVHWSSGVWIVRELLHYRAYC
jgi:hypothetical protein